MTAAEAYELTTRGGTSDFLHVVDICESFGAYCLIGGLAVNCYVEPVYTLDADLVVIADHLHDVTSQLRTAGFAIENFRASINAQSPASDLRIQFTTDQRYQPFPARAQVHPVFGRSVKVASLEDVTRGKLWAYSDPERRLSKRKKDELDLIRLAEAYPTLKPLYPPAILAELEQS